MPSNNHPAEIFGYPIDNASREAQQDRQRYWCPFMSRVCSKTSRLLDLNVRLHARLKLNFS